MAKLSDVIATEIERQGAMMAGLQADAAETLALLSDCVACLADAYATLRAAELLPGPRDDREEWRG